MSDLSNLIAQQRQEVSVANTVDWGKRREKWIHELKKLFHQIEAWLSAAGLPKADIQLNDRETYEEKLGRYHVPTLKVKLPVATIKFLPRASVIIGGLGRVDVTGTDDLQTFYLIANDADEDQVDTETRSYEREWGWRIFDPRNPRPKPINFSEQSLTELLSTLSKRVR